MKRLGNRDFCLALWVLAVAVWILPGGVLDITPYASGTMITAPSLNSRYSQIKLWSSNIGNENIASNAAVAYSKLNLAYSIKNTDVANDAGIGQHKIDWDAANITNDQIKTDAGIDPAKIADAGDQTRSFYLTISATSPAMMLTSCQDTNCCTIGRIVFDRPVLITNIHAAAINNGGIDGVVALVDMKADGGGSNIGVFDASLTYPGLAATATELMFSDEGTMDFAACEWEENVYNLTFTIRGVENP